MNFSSLFLETAAAVRACLDSGTDWGPTNAKQGQHIADVAADEAALEVLLAAEVGVLSEETGLHNPDNEIIVVLDPVDGSTNAAFGIPWYAVSLCALSRQGEGYVPVAAHVENLVSGVTYVAESEATASTFRRDYGGSGGAASNLPKPRPTGTTSSPPAPKSNPPGAVSSPPEPLAPAVCEDMGQALIGVSGYPARHWGWNQYRGLGSAALDMCLVAGGGLSAFADVTRGELAPWDYMGAMFICQQAGAHVVDGNGDDLLTVDPQARRRPVAASSVALAEAICRQLAEG